MSPHTPPDSEQLPDLPDALDELLAGWAAATGMSAPTADAMAAAITATPAPVLVSPAPVLAGAREPGPAVIRERAAWWRQHQRDLARTFLQSNGITAA